MESLYVHGEGQGLVRLEQIGGTGDARRAGGALGARKRDQAAGRLGLRLCRETDRRERSFTRCEEAQSDLRCLEDRVVRTMYPVGAQIDEEMMEMLGKKEEEKKRERERNEGFLLEGRKVLVWEHLGSICQE